MNSSSLGSQYMTPQKAEDKISSPAKTESSYSRPDRAMETLSTKARSAQIVKGKLLSVHQEFLARGT